MQPNDDSCSREEQLDRLHDGNLSQYFNVILKHWKLIGNIVGATFVLSILVSLILPKMYLASARILPPKDNDTGIASLLSNYDDPLSGLAGSLISKQTPAGLYVGIMKSRSVADALISKFKLKDLYDLKYIEDVYSKLEDRTVIEISKKDQLISVSFRDNDPQRAAAIANAYVEMLDRINRRLNITQAKRKRIFLEDRLKEVRVNLEEAEIDLKHFQEKYHLVSIEEQAKVAIEGAAKIKGQIIAAQTELDVFKESGTERQIEAIMLKAKIKALEKRLYSMGKGEEIEPVISNLPNTEKEPNFYIPIDDLPSLGMQLFRLTREAKIQGKLFELLTTEYEMAQIEEAKDVDTIQVLDRAVAPEKKDSPKRIRIVITSTILVFFATVIVVICKEYQCRWEQKDMIHPASQKETK